MYENYWKNRYSHSWESSSRREALVAQIIEEHVPCKVVPGSGLGAGSREYISGNAASAGAERSGSDLQIEGTDIHIEVTGPNKKVADSAPLWIRPDKLYVARSHPERDTWVVHCSFDNYHQRVIHLDDDFFAAWDGGEFEEIHPHIRETKETYIAIPAGSKVVRPLQHLVDAVLMKLAK